ncbi:MAG: PIN domain-containing protein [Pseudonocardiaceae bacterium]
MVDTSVWLDLAKRRDGQKLIHAIGQIVLGGDVELLVPSIVIDEFERNRERIERSMTTSVADRFKMLKKDLEDLSAEWHRPAFDALAGLAHEMPLIGAMAMRNFTDILQLLNEGQPMIGTEVERDRVVRRGLQKQAPFHRNKNSTADGLLIELYATATRGLEDDEQRYCFVTSNWEDFSVQQGDQRQPHPDIADLFNETTSRYFYRVDGLNAALGEHLGEEYEEILEMSDFQEDPRTLDEILEAEKEFFDRVWYERSLLHTYRYEHGNEEGITEAQYQVSLDAQARVKARRPDLRPVESNFEWGMWNGKLSTLRWVLGSEWDFLDT